MTSPAILGPLSGLHEMMRQLLASVPASDANRQFHPQLPSLGWYLGRSVYRETYWLREVLNDDADLTARVRRFFVLGELPLSEQCAQLPPPKHLLNWAAEIQDEQLRRLANSGLLNTHPLTHGDRLQWFLLQENSRDYECMLTVLLLRRLAQTKTDYRVSSPLDPRQLDTGCAAIAQGHYRIGSRHEPFAYDNELPPQAVELSSFRIARHPVTNAEFLAFIEAGGYQHRAFWSDPGWSWFTQFRIAHPLHWRRDAGGHWYGIGLNGASDLEPAEPVMGISRHEAKAFANWASARGDSLAGAVLQHEYQWEVAARSGAIAGTGRVWEWCANPFHPYPEFTPFPDATPSQAFFGGDHFSLRGASLHTQPALRRASFRYWARAEENFRFAGLRLVFPPDD